MSDGTNKHEANEHASEERGGVVDTVVDKVAGSFGIDVEACRKFFPSLVRVGPEAAKLVKSAVAGARAFADEMRRQ